MLNSLHSSPRVDTNVSSTHAHPARRVYAGDVKALQPNDPLAHQNHPSHSSRLDNIRPHTPWDLAGVLACLWWATQSVALVLANKAIFSQPLFDYPWLIITIQSTVVVFAFSLVAAVRREAPPVRLSQFSNMLVPSCLFILYNYSNARSLRFISLPAFTVVKSLAPLGVTTVERMAFGHSIPSGVYLALAVSLMGNVFTFDSASAISETSMLGYAWSVFNVSTHIFYVLSLRYCSGTYRATDKAFIANLVTVPVAFCFAVANQELGTFTHEVAVLPSSSRIPLVFSFALSAGCVVSVLSAFEAASSDALRYLAQTNKIAIVLLGAAIFRTKLTPHAWLGVALAVLSGFLFVYAKSKWHNTTSGLPRPIVSSPTLELLLPTEDSATDIVNNNIGEDGQTCRHRNASTVTQTTAVATTASATTIAVCVESDAHAENL